MSTTLYSTDTSNIGVQNLKAVGSDALTNLYCLEFSGWDISEDEKMFLLVNNQGIAFPTFSQGTYTKSFLTQDIQLPNSKITGNRSFSVSFNIDSQYKIYKALIKCRNKTSNPSLGIAYNVSGNTHNNGLIGQISVRLLDQEYNTSYDVYNSNALNMMDDSQIQWIFKNCWISSMSENNLTPSSSNSRTCSVTFNFIDYIDPSRIMTITGQA